METGIFTFDTESDSDQRADTFYSEIKPEQTSSEIKLEEKAYKILLAKTETETELEIETDTNSENRKENIREIRNIIYEAKCLIDNTQEKIQNMIIDSNEFLMKKKEITKIDEENKILLLFFLIFLPYLFTFGLLK